MRSDLIVCRSVTFPFVFFFVNPKKENFFLHATLCSRFGYYRITLLLTSSSYLFGSRRRSRKGRVGEG